MNYIKTEIDKFSTWVNQDGDDCILKEDVIKICKNLFEQHIEDIFQRGAFSSVYSCKNECKVVSENYQKDKKEFIEYFLENKL